MTNAMKINWFSNAPFANTGYGVQTKLAAFRIAHQLGYPVSITANHGLQSSTLTIDGLTVYPRGMLEFSQDIISACALHAGADIVITLIDAWVIPPEMIVPPLKWVPWFPVDHEPLPPQVKANVSQAHERIVFSKFAVKQMEQAGLNCYYVPHVVDTKAYYPVAKAEARARLGWPADRHITGMVAMNKDYPARKAFVQQIEAFASLHAKHPDTLLYLHTNMIGGVNLNDVLRVYNLQSGRDVIVVDQFIPIVGAGDSYMRDMYSAMDCLTSVSLGEGFGVPIIEAQACGTPVIVGDWTSMSELCFAGWKVAKTEAQRVFDGQNAYQYSPNPAAITERMEAAYLARDLDSLKQRAVDGAAKYDADRVALKYWKPVLEEIAAGLK